MCIPMRFAALEPYGRVPWPLAGAVAPLARSTWMFLTEDRALLDAFRAGEPAANPYLFIASQILAGLDGVGRKTKLAPPDDDPYNADRPKLPGDLVSALSAFAESDLFRSAWGEVYVDYYRALKQAELDRFTQYCQDNAIDPAGPDVTGSEQNEYYDFF